MNTDLTLPKFLVRKEQAKARKSTKAAATPAAQQPARNYEAEYRDEQLAKVKPEARDAVAELVRARKVRLEWLDDPTTVAMLEREALTPRAKMSDETKAALKERRQRSRRPQVPAGYVDLKSLAKTLGIKPGLARRTIRKALKIPRPGYGWHFSPTEVEDLTQRIPRAIAAKAAAKAGVPPKAAPPKAVAKPAPVKKPKSPPTKKPVKKAPAKKAVAKAGPKRSKRS